MRNVILQVPVGLQLECKLPEASHLFCLLFVRWRYTCRDGKKIQSFVLKILPTHSEEDAEEKRATTITFTDNYKRSWEVFLSTELTLVLPPPQGFLAS